MALKSRFSQADIRKVLDTSLRHIKTGIVQSMKKMGEESIKIARDNANVIDATGKLAQLIGYIIVADGLIIAKEFSQGSERIDKPVHTGENLSDDQNEATDDDAQTGENYAKALAARYPKGFALIVVSGSEYAVQAKSLSNDVLTSAEMYMEQKLPELLDGLLKK